MKWQGSDAADAPVRRASRCLEGETARLMLLMLLFGGPLDVWNVKRQGSDAADAPV